MELHHCKSRPEKANAAEDYRFLISSSAKALQPCAAAAHQYQLLHSPSKHYPRIRSSRADSVISKMVKLGESMDVFVRGIREHVRLGPKFSETVKGKLRLGARILQVGGVEKVFKHNFSLKDGEKLLSASQCYLSTTDGPIAGLLFVSSERVGFCSDRSIKLSSPTGKILKLHYKVMIPLRKVKRAVESENAMKPRQKYVEIVTEDSFEFWFMGLLNHQRTLRQLQQAIHQSRREFLGAELL